MEMETVKYLQILTEEIHSVVVTTLNEEGRPETRVIDMMLYDEQGIYFLTARGKSFYHQLMQQGYVSLSGTKAKRAVRVDGKVRNIGHKKLAEIFVHNPYMGKIYPGDTCEVLEVFQLYEGTGEFFDISDPAHIERGSFVIGKVTDVATGYQVSEACIGCRRCLSVCPQSCIAIGKDGRAKIDAAHCLSCGRCAEVCPVQAVHRPQK